MPESPEYKTASRPAMQSFIVHRNTRLTPCTYWRSNIELESGIESTDFSDRKIGQIRSRYWRTRLSPSLLN
jgi:hypothetical protein